MTFPILEKLRFKTHQLARKFREKFIQEYGSVICRDIQNKVLGRYYYLPDPQEFEKFHNAGAHEIHCPEVVGKAARWMTEIILQEGLLPRKKMGNEMIIDQIRTLRLSPENALIQERNSRDSEREGEFLNEGSNHDPE